MAGVSRHEHHRGPARSLGPERLRGGDRSPDRGRLGDLFGRKRIYQYDLLLYAFGTLLIVFAVNLPMLLIGTFKVGVAVGADAPTSRALIGKYSPSKDRGRLMGLSQVAWSLGPIVVFVLAFALSPYGVLGNRIVFAHLFVVAIVTWALRRGMVESALWTAASGAGEAERTTAPEEQPEEAGVPADPLATSRLRGLFMNAWCEQGPTHHCALGVGQKAGTLRKVCRLLNLEFVEVGKAADKTLVGGIT